MSVVKTESLIGTKLWECKIVGIGAPDAQRHPTLIVVCVCRGKRPGKNAPTFMVRRDKFLSGETKTCGCKKKIGMLGNCRAKKAPEKQLGRTLAETRASIDDSEVGEVFLKVERDKPVVRPRCPHDRYLLDPELESGISHDCVQCTPKPVSTAPLPVVGKAWQLKLKMENLDVNRGMSLEGGKNLVTGGRVADKQALSEESEASIPAQRSRASGTSPEVDLDVSNREYESPLPHSDNAPDLKLTKREAEENSEPAIDQRVESLPKFDAVLKADKTEYRVRKMDGVYVIFEDGVPTEKKFASKVLADHECRELKKAEQ
jgi:hypothetical protein